MAAFRRDREMQDLEFKQMEAEEQFQQLLAQALAASLRDPVRETLKREIADDNRGILKCAKVEAIEPVLMPAHQNAIRLRFRLESGVILDVTLCAQERVGTLAKYLEFITKCDKRIIVYHNRSRLDHNLSLEECQVKDRSTLNIDTE